MQDEIEAVRQVFQKFQDAYTARDASRIEAAMALVALRQDVEMIGIGAYERNGYEWFQGREAIREIILGDWEYWGDVRFDVAGAKITVLGETAWLSTTGQVIQTDAHDKAMLEYAKMMREILEKAGMEDGNADQVMMEATHYGLRRLRERVKGTGYGWPLVFTAVLTHSEAGWQFHTLHWAMPVD